MTLFLPHLYECTEIATRVFVLFHVFFFFVFFCPAEESFRLFIFLYPWTATVCCLSSELDSFMFIYCLTVYWAESLKLQKNMLEWKPVRMLGMVRNMVLK